MATQYTKMITIAVPDGVDAPDIEADINTHLGGTNTFSAGGVYENSAGDLYRVLSFAAKADFNPVVFAGALLAIDAIGVSGITQLSNMGLNPAEQ